MVIDLSCPSWYVIFELADKGKPVETRGHKTDRPYLFQTGRARRDWWASRTVQGGDGQNGGWVAEARWGRYPHLYRLSFFLQLIINSIKFKRWRFFCLHAGLKLYLETASSNWWKVYCFFIYIFYTSNSSSKFKWGEKLNFDELFEV